MQNFDFTVTQVRDAAIISAAGVEATFSIDVEEATELGETPVEFFANWKNEYLLHFPCRKTASAFLALEDEQIEKHIKQYFADKLQTLSDAERIEYFERAGVSTDVEIVSQVTLAETNASEASALRTEINELASRLYLLEAAERAHLEARDQAFGKIKERLGVLGIQTNRLILKRPQGLVAYQLD